MHFNIVHHLLLSSRILTARPALLITHVVKSVQASGKWQLKRHLCNQLLHQDTGSASPETMVKQIDYTEMRESRSAKRKKLKSYGPPANVKFQVLGTGTEGSPAALFVFTTNGSYLFNCGEGTQRLSAERKTRLVNLEHVFITRNVWSNVGGILGALLTTNDMGLPELTLHGPPGLSALYKDTRSFIQLHGMQVMHRHEVNQDLVESGMTVRAVPLYGAAIQQQSGEAEVDQVAPSVDYFAYERTGGKERSVTPLQTAEGEKSSSPSPPPLPDQACTYAYICTLASRRGKLLLERCVQMGVPPGPLLGKLKNGQDIELPDGKVVKSSDVTSPDELGAQFLVMDLPSEDFLPSLPNLDSSIDVTHLAAVVHFSSPSVMDSAEYRGWTGRLPRRVRHIVLNIDGRGYGSEAVHRQQYSLNMLDEDVFPLLAGDDVDIEDPEPPSKKQRISPDVEPTTVAAEGTDGPDANQQPNHVEDTDAGREASLAHRGGSSQTKDAAEEHLVAEKSTADEDEKAGNGSEMEVDEGAVTLIYPPPGWELSLRPSGHPDTSGVVPIQPRTFLADLKAKPAFTSRLAEYQQAVSVLPQGCSTSGDDSGGGGEKYPQTVFLGTGSCIPNKKRNTSGILVNLSAEHSMLMDCGEGTYGQLVRLLGKAEVANTLRRMGVIYISHLHADHHMGLISILEARRRALGGDHTPCVLLAPTPILNYLIMYQNNMAPILDTFTLIGNKRLLASSSPLPPHHLTRLRAAGLHEVATCRVMHCPHAYGVRVSGSGRSVVYSGDTRPCDDLVQLGTGCDLLIHEATHEDALHDEAVLRAHSTSSEAIEIGRRMGARHVILTHFSQRYATMPLLPDDAPGNVGVAYDSMVINFGHLPRLPLMLPALREAFADYIDQCVERLARRETRKQRETEALVNNPS